MSSPILDVKRSFFWRNRINRDYLFHKAFNVGSQRSNNNNDGCNNYQFNHKSSDKGSGQLSKSHSDSSIQSHSTKVIYPESSKAVGQSSILKESNPTAISSHGTKVIYPETSKKRVTFGPISVIEIPVITYESDDESPIPDDNHSEPEKHVTFGFDTVFYYKRPDMRDYADYTYVFPAREKQSKISKFFEFMLRK